MDKVMVCTFMVVRCHHPCDGGSGFVGFGGGGGWICGIWWRWWWMISGIWWQL
ncbi:hypothetical protein Hanom_Chr17g01540331 [Helianthus anomalus]